jgi:PKD repeat protein
MKNKGIISAIIMLCLISTGGFSQHLCDSLLFYYPFTGNASDASGNGFNGTVHGVTLSDDRLGQPNSSYYFPGSYGYIDLPASQRLKPQLPFTVSAWVLFKDLNNLYQIFTSDYYTQAYTGCWLGLSPFNDTVLSMCYGDGGLVGDPSARRSKIGTTHVLKNQWYHVTAVFRGPSDMALYVNGLNENGIYDGLGGNIYYTNNPGSVGRHCFSTYVPAEASYMYGKIDEVAFWNRALSPEEVTELYLYGITPKPSASFSHVTQGKTVTFTDRSLNPATWHWDFGDGSTSSLQNPVNTYSNFQSYPVSLTVQNSCGTSIATDTVTITCHPPVADFSFSVLGFDAHFLDLSQLADGWLWDFGDGGTSTAQNPTHTYTHGGFFPVLLTVTDSCGTATHGDTVEISCRLPVAGFYYNFENDGVNFYDTTLSNTEYAWRWSFGDSNFSDVQNPFHNYHVQGTYHVCMVVTDSCSVDSVCNEVYYYLPLHVGFTSGQSATNGLEVAFKDQTAGATTWLWHFGDGDTSPQKDPVHTYTDYGKYWVCLEAGNGTSQAASCDSLILQKKSVNPGTSTVIYPNPALTEKVTISFAYSATEVKITLADIIGNSIITWQVSAIIEGQPMDLILPDLPSGLYYFKTESGEHRDVLKLVIP